MCVYGPVASMGLGRSLKVCPVPAETCTSSCIYCHLGLPDRVTVRRRAFHERNGLLQRILDVCRKARPDYVTFTGGGEPTLERNLGWLVRETRKRADVPVAVETKGTLLHRRDVRQDLAQADLVISSVDAGTEDLFLEINRPHVALDFVHVRDGLLQFRDDFNGNLWLDVMLVRDLNDGPDALAEIRKRLDQVGTGQVRVRVPFRPPAESSVRPPTREILARAVQILGVTARAFEPVFGRIEPCAFSEATRAISTIAACHPLRLSQAAELERDLRSPGALSRMIEVGDLLVTEWQGELFLRNRPGMPQHAAAKSMAKSGENDRRGARADKR